MTEHTKKRPESLTPDQSADVIRYYYNGNDVSRGAHENNREDPVRLAQVAIETTLESSSLLPPDNHGEIRPTLTKGEKSIGRDRIENPSVPLESRRYYKKLLELIDGEGYSYDGAREILRSGEG